MEFPLLYAPIRGKILMWYKLTTNQKGEQNDSSQPNRKNPQKRT